jgi:hypothetical protein
MAKIRIKGDTSGYVDLDVPNAASSSTLDLDQVPQKNVANTFTTGQNITVPGNGGLTIQAGTNGSASLRLKNDATDWDVNCQTTDNFAIYNHTTGGSRLGITPAGIVTTPNQPAFSIYGDTNPNWTSDVIYLGHTGSGAAAFDTNIGNHFSYTTGKFTAPVAGTYFFSFRATTADTNQHFMDIYKNGARVGGHTLSYSYAYLTAANTAVLTLASGDYIEARRRAANYSLYTTNFSGFLIG